MGSTRLPEAEVGRPELVTAEPPNQSDAATVSLAWTTSALAAATVVLFGFLLLAGRATSDTDPTQPPLSPSAEIARQPSTSIVAQGTREIDRFDGPVLGVSTGAIAISTDFDGRITALELDSGVVTRTSIRTGAFITVDGTLVVRTGCGAWQKVEIPEYELGDNLIGCGSYRPIGQRGAEVVFFASVEADRAGAVLIADRHGVVGVNLTDVAASVQAPVSEDRFLTQAAESELIQVRTSSGEPEYYTDGKLIDSDAGGVLWADCATSTSCDVWFGTAAQARVRRYRVESQDGTFLARINNDGSRAVFFLDNDILRIVSLETGHARELENPGVEWSTATWSPDGLWLLDPLGTDVVALNTLNGRTVRFDGVPGDVSPGWVALIEGG